MPIAVEVEGMAFDRVEDEIGIEVRVDDLGGRRDGQAEGKTRRGGIGRETLREEVVEVRIGTPHRSEG
jgi:hypothetical protein